MNLILISTNTRLYYGIITKDSFNNIVYDVLASDAIYKENNRQIYNNNFNDNDIQKIINDNIKNDVYFTNKINKIKKIKHAIINKNKLLIIQMMI